jgi:hypothetical protein
MTSYTFSEALALVESTVDDTTLVTNFVANTSTVPPGVAMIEADIDALLNLTLYYGQVGGDLVNVFAQQFQAIILETLAAATLASNIVSNIEAAITIGEVAPKPPTAAIALSATPPWQRFSIGLFRNCRQGRTATPTAPRSRGSIL